MTADVEEGLHRGALRAGADRLGAASAAEDERQGVDDNRLTGSRLAGQQVEARAEIEGGLADDRQVRDV